MEGLSLKNGVAMCGRSWSVCKVLVWVEGLTLKNGVGLCGRSWFMWKVLVYEECFGLMRRSCHRREVLVLQEDDGLGGRSWS